MVLIVVAYFVINLIVAEHMKKAAYAKGYDDSSHAWAMSFWLGIAGWFYVAALPDLVARKNQETLISVLSNVRVQNTTTADEDELPEL